MLTKTGALIIATGTTHHSAKIEPMRQIGSISVVQRLCMTFHLAGIFPIAVVVSAEDQHAMEQHLARMPVVFIRGTDAVEEMFDGVKAGLSYFATSTTERILVTPAHVPLFSVETVKQLLAAQGSLVIPVCKEHKGHPLLVDAKLIPALVQYDGDYGLGGAIRHCMCEPVLVEVDDSGVYVRSDQFDACEKIVVTHNLSQWRPVMKLRIAKESNFFGPGSWQLLSLIETTGSVRIASAYMGISYSKAWKILNHLEQQAGYPVLIRKKGGKGGGTSYLTAQGQALMAWYEQLEKRCNQAVWAIFQQNPPPSVPR